LNGLNGKVIKEVAKHPLVAVVIITLALLYMVQGMIDSQDRRAEKQVETMGEISASLINLNNGQDNLVENNNDFLDALRDLTYEIKQLNGRN